ncbi:hypothetical protein Tco_0005411 [Tanacetum coccineum]
MPPTCLLECQTDSCIVLQKYVIETLSGPPLIEIQQEQEEEDRVIEKVQRFQSAAATLPMDLKENLFKKNGRLIETVRANTPMAGNGKSGKFWVTTTPKKVDEGITIDHLHRLNQKNISAWNIKRLMHIVQKGTLSTLDEQLEGSRVYEEDETAVHITDEMQAKIAAKKIFINVAKQGSKCIYLEVLMHFLIEDEALKVIRLFYGESETQGISKRALKIWVVDVFRERKALALSLDDTKTVVRNLHQMLNIAVGNVVFQEVLSYDAIVYALINHVALGIGCPDHGYLFGIDIPIQVTAAPTIPVFAEENLGDPIDIRMDIIHLEHVDVVTFPTAAEELMALRFRVDIKKAENDSLHASIKTTKAIKKITCNCERQACIKIEQQLAAV